MTRRPQLLVLLLAALALIAWIAWPDARPPSPSHGDPGKDGAAPGSGLRLLEERAPESGGAPARHAPGRKSGGTSRSTPPQRSEAPRGGGPSTPGRGVIRGRAAVPGELARDQSRMALHVTRAYEMDFGTASESWTVPDPIRPDGTYELGGLPPGRYFVQFVLDGRAVSEPIRLRLAAGGKASGRNFKFEREAVLSGHVYAQLGGAPLKGTTIRIRGEPPETTDEEGRYTLHDLPPGEYDALYVHPDHAPQRVMLRVKERGLTTAPGVYLAPGAQARIEALASDGSPQASVFVSLSSELHVVSGMTDEDGIATFKGLAPGARYRVMLPGRRLDDRATLLVPELDSVRQVSLELPD